MSVLDCLAGGGDRQMLQACAKVSIGVAVIEERQWLRLMQNNWTMWA